MCDTTVVVHEDRVLFAKNSDRDPNEAQRLEWHRAEEHAEGARLRCTWIDIPQVRRTNAIVIARPFWMWGAEMGTNEHGVTIGNEAVFTREHVAKVGLTGMDLLRLALERASTASEAVAIVVSLMRTHGQGGRCGHENASFRYHSSFLIADPRGAFVLETTARDHAIERVSGARSISNGLTIDAFAQEHARAIPEWVCGCVTRRNRTEEKVAHARDVRDLFAILRDHGDGTDHPRYRFATGGMDAPCMHAGGVLVSSQTVGSWASELRPNAVSHWATGTAAPCTSLFKPIRIDEPIDVGAPSDRNDESLFWRHERLHRAVMRDPSRFLALYRKERDEVERAWVAAPPDSRQAFATAEALERQWLQAVLSQRPIDQRPSWVRRYFRQRDRRAGLDDS